MQLLTHFYLVKVRGRLQLSGGIVQLSKQPWHQLPIVRHPQSCGSDE